MATDNLPAAYPPRKQGERYPAETYVRGITAMILNGGNSWKAREMLLAQGHDIPARTLGYWKTLRADQYAQLQAELAPQMAERIAADAEAFIMQATEVEGLLLQELAAKRANLTANETAGALRNVTTAKTLNLDKIASPLRGRPSRVTEVRDVADILRSLENKLPKPAIDTTATEITDVT